MKITVQSFLFSSEIMTENNAKLWKPNEVNPSLGNLRQQLSETSGRSSIRELLSKRRTLN